MTAKMIRLLFILCCSASWMLAQSSPGTATPPAQTATPPAHTATPPAQTATPPAPTATPPARTAPPPAQAATPQTTPQTFPQSSPYWIAADYGEFRFNELGQRLLRPVTDEFRSDVGINRERHALSTCVVADWNN